MKRKIIAMGVLLCTFGFTPSYATITAPQFFLKIRSSIYQSLPSKFKAILESPVIEQQLGKIHKDFWIDKNKTPYAQVTFSKANGVMIKVKNVDSFYENMFEEYVRFFEMGNILSNISDTAVLQKYEINYQSSTKNLTILSLRLKQENQANQMHIYVDNNSLEVLRIDYLLGKDLISTTALMYTQIKSKGKTYNIPHKFLVKVFEEGNSKNLFFTLNNITIK